MQILENVIRILERKESEAIKRLIETCKKCGESQKYHLRGNKR